MGTPVAPGHVGLTLGHVVGLGVVHSMGTLPGEIRNLPGQREIWGRSLRFRAIITAKEFSWTSVDATVLQNTKKILRIYL